MLTILNGESMNEHPGEFFDDPAVTAAISAYSDAAFDHLRSGGRPDSLPDAAPFFRDAGVSDLDSGSIQVQHTVGDPDHTDRPVPTCDDGPGYCIPSPGDVHGEVQCLWICKCPI
jgi:hypothetical protein